MTKWTSIARKMVAGLGTRPGELIQVRDLSRGGIVSNLPAGSVYTTVLEEETEGEVLFPQAGPAKDVVLHFERGRASVVSAASGSETLEAMFDARSGEPRRISHIGIGLNPRLHDPVGWTLVDSHLPGYVFVAFGENRYMGGRNESSLNVDFALPGATLDVDGKTLLRAGETEF